MKRSLSMIDINNEAMVKLEKLRIGAYGGTFDPIHNGHIEIARSIVKEFSLNRLLLIPAARPPHKNLRSILDSYHRHAMAVLATIDIPEIEVSTIELEAPERPYAYETMEQLKNLYGSTASLFFLMGADSFEEIHLWRHPERILACSDVIVISRPGYSFDRSNLPEEYKAAIVDIRGTSIPEFNLGKDGGMVFLTDCVNIDISSTGIRNRVRQGNDVGDYLHPSVAKYIKKNNLYKSGITGKV